MKSLRTGRVAAIIIGLIVALIWSSSFVFVKMILPDMGPLTIAGLRYFGAFIVLLPFMIQRKQDLQSIEVATWLQFTLIGLSAFLVGNGALFWGMQYLPATTSSFLMGIIPLLVLLAGTVFLNEVPTRLQIVGVAISLLGNAVFFSSGLRPGEPRGMAIMAVGLLGFVTSTILGRGLARENRTNTFHLTGIPLGIGGAVSLLIALPLEGWPVFTPKVLLVILWLALINTAAAYLLYYHAIKEITALEMSILLNLSPLGTAAIAWFFLDESLTLKQLTGVVIVIIGVTLVQVKRNFSKATGHVGTSKGITD